MFSRVQLESNDHVFAFVAFLQANPELKPLVHTIITTPAAFGPSLLYVLPNLSSVECVDESQLGEPEDEDDEDEQGKDQDKHVFQKLEHALLRSPRSRVTVVVPDPADAKVLSFWAHELGKHMPVLLARGGVVTVECKDGPDSSAPPHHDVVQALVVSPDSKWIATGSLDSTIVLWNTADGSLVQRWIPHNYTPVGSLAFSPDSRFLVSSGDDGKAAVWEFGHGPSACRIATLEGHTGPVLICAWSPDGDTIVTGSEDGIARLWDACTPTYRQRALIQLKNAVVSLSFSADGSWLACGSRRGECCIVNVAQGTVHRSLWNSSSDNGNPYSQWQARDTIAVFDPISGSTRLATAPCGTCAGINVVDVKTASVLAHMGGKIGEVISMQDVAFSPDGTLVLGVPVLPALPAPPNLRSAVSIWRADTGADRFKLTGHTGDVRRARFSPCGRYIASAAADRTVRVWRTGGVWPCVATLSEHGEAVDHVAFSPDGRTLSSGARDGTVVIRQMRDIVLKEEQDQDLEQLLSILRGTSSVDPVLSSWFLSDSRPRSSGDDELEAKARIRDKLKVEPAGGSSSSSATKLPLDRNSKAKSETFE
ncbi:hypothetical protein GSI_08130 [Ganoderma sinense ZZ0214-1]|uniref:Uncharacterized protein n=1 Tax=Ganoderma sinense ZZ0214-1 TaxID=1077348 RepID=A0A2G8S7C9_9APHY|nr:hypothetical protein GSI_08130 [Ganoderma sinense ZZ0214-1]